MLLENKNAIVYGAAGSIGTAVSTTFAREGARVFLVGRTRETLEQLAKEITEAGGRAEVAALDVLDEEAVDGHARSVLDSVGSIDVSINLVSGGDLQGIPIADMTTADYTRPIRTRLTANFITARAAARHMTKQGSGVILALDSGSAQASPMMGGTGSADAATDALIRNLAFEIGPAGVRVLGIWTAGLPETLSLEKVNAHSGGQLEQAAFDGILAHLEGMRMTRRSPTLAQVAATAAFLASDHAGAITGTFVNVTSGTFPS